jgi:N12 class adenine-specific DNA methylase/adenine-specific DNA methylase
MQDAAQYTLGLFEGTALGWTLDAPRVTQAVVPATVGDDDGDETDAAPASAGSTAAAASNYHLDGDRPLARGWPARARDNIAAIRLSKELEATGRAPTPDEQERLLRFVGFGATDLAQNCFPLPGATGFREGWEEIGQGLAGLVTREEYLSLQRATQYAHFTPEILVRALWRAAERLGFSGGKALEPGIGTGLFFALLPPALREACQLTGVEYDPVTARIARFIHPRARIRCEDFCRSRLGGGFDLAIGNPPFADRTVRADPATAALGLRLHDFFIARSIARLRPGGLALFVTSTGTMDKANPTARAHIAGMADLVGAVRLPEGSLRATAGTQVVVDLLVFQRRAEGAAARSLAWVDLAEIALDHAAEAGASDAPTMAEDVEQKDVPETPGAAPPPATVAINRYFVEHPEMVLGTHALRRGIHGPAPSYTCLPRAGAAPLEDLLDTALGRLPTGLFTPSPASAAADEEDDEPPVRPGTAADGATIKEGSYYVGRDGRLMQIIDGRGVAVAIRQGKAGAGIPASSAKIVRALLPIRDAIREVLRAQAADRPWAAAQIRLRTAYSGFVRYFGPINHTVVTVTTDKETGEERETHRRTNLAPFADDPDCWLVASIENYDLETGLARQGPIFRDRVIAPPAAPLIATAADALAVTLNERGRVDIDSIAELLEQDSEAALAQLGATIFRNPATGGWETADAYLSGPVRSKLAAAIVAAAADPRFQCNVDALRDVQPEDLRPSDITCRLGAPWLPTDVVEAFSAEIMGAEITLFHSEAVATWTVLGDAFDGTALGTSEWGTSRRHAGQLLHDALNGGTPQIFDTVYEDNVEKRALNVEATEAAKEKLARIKAAFTDWVWTDPDRTDRLARIYNDRFNNLVPRHFDGSHLTLPGASSVIQLRPHQKRVIWRAIAAGGCYIAHAVGAGKTFSIAAAVMEQKRLGLISKAMLVVPGHCLAQASREFLQLYPTAHILVADESNFTKDKRARFLARAATATWDAIIITHSAFRFIAVPAAFERGMIEDEVSLCSGILAEVHDDDRVTRKRLEAMKEKLTERLQALRTRKDDMLTIEELGVDQLIVDEAQEFRKLSFRTNRTNLKGVDPDGSQRAWDLFVKARFIDSKNPGRALIQASGTPVTNTLGEMFTLLRFQAEDTLRERGVHAFDAWASAFGDTSTELELQPSGAYKPVERFCEFINVPELIDMFRSVADVVLKDDLRSHVRLPRLLGGQRQLITAPASDAFRSYQKHLARRIEAIEERTRKVQPGDDIILAVITDGRHAAIDMRLVWPASDNEPDNKLNKLIANVHRIWLEAGSARFRQADGTLHPVSGAAQMIFSDLGTVAVEAKRGFSAYRWIRQELIRLGVPASEIAFMQDYRRSADKQRLFNEVNAGRVRVLLGSSETMGTGVNAQLRLKALHHLDVPWLPSQIEQREGRIERQGNQNDEIELYAYATLGSMDATMWQTNERKARFIAAALSGDRGIRRLEDIGSQVNQFAMAKAIASGDGRLLLKAGLENEIARLQRQRAAHIDDQHDIRRRLHNARNARDHAMLRIAAIEQDIACRLVTRGELFTMEVNGRTFSERKPAGDSLLSNIRLAELERASRTWTIGRIGGFDLVCRAVHDPREKLTPTTLLPIRTEGGQTIGVEPDLTAMGLIARLEHVINRFDADLEEQVRRRDDAIGQIAGYEPRLGAPFQLQPELDEKLARMAELEADLARTESIIADDEPTSPPTDEALLPPLAEAAD